jgi:AcrR family transcriptional regulator
MLTISAKGIDAEEHRAAVPCRSVPPRSRRATPDKAPRPAGERLHRGRTLEERRSERRSALLAAALDLFGTKGYAATSIEDLCAASYVTNRYLYEEFGGREALLVALYDHLIAQVGEAVLAVSAPPGPDHVRDATRDRIAAFVRGVTDDERVARVLFLEGGNASAALERRRRDAHAYFAEYVAQLAFPYAASGEIEVRNFHLLALGFVGAVNEIVTHWILTEPGERVEVDEIIGAAMEMYLLVRAGLERDAGDHRPRS